MYRYVCRESEANPLLGGQHRQGRQAVREGHAGLAPRFVELELHDEEILRR